MVDAPEKPQQSHSQAKRRERDLTPQARAELHRTLRATRESIPGEIRSAVVREFLWWFAELEAGGQAGRGRDYGGATAQDVRQTVEAAIKKLQHADYGAGDDVLIVAGEYAEECHCCLRQREVLTAFDKPGRVLCRKGA